MKSNSILHLDQDGVLTDFDNRFKDFSGGLTPEEYKEAHGSDKRKSLYSQLPLEFWTEMRWVQGGQDLVNFAFTHFNVVRVLTSTGTGNDLGRFKLVQEGKLQWFSKNIPQLEKKNILFVPYANLKAARHAAPERILIDDKDTTINSWNKRGGHGILHHSTRFQESLATLQQYTNTSK
jgi:hypothetical protein